jgi:RNA polymerase sigma-70 factor (sigma-E family)
MVARAEQRVTEQADASPGQPGFDRLYRQMWWPMVRLAAGLVDDRAAAEDAVQDAFAAVYRRWDSIRDPAAAPGYVRAAVVNASRSSIRRQIVARKYLHVVEDPPDAPADHTVLLGAEHDMLRTAMSMLPERQREVLVLRFVAELADADIARATGLSEGGVRSASSRGLATLRKTLGGQL